MISVQIVKREKIASDVLGWLAHLEEHEPEAFEAIVGFFANPGFKTLEIHANDNRIVMASCHLNFKFRRSPSPE